MSQNRNGNTNGNGSTKNVSKGFTKVSVKDGVASMWERPVKGLGAFHIRVAVKGQPAGMKSFKTKASMESFVGQLVSMGKGIKVSPEAVAHRQKYNKAVGNPTDVPFEF